MRPARVTLADLARALDLSTCTVSKVLNRSFDGFSYSKETISRVEAMASKMGYTANAQARSLRTRRTQLVGFLLPTAEITLFGALTDRLEQELRAHGYQLLIVHSRNDPKAEPELIASLIAHGADGLIWIPSREKKVDPAALRPGFPAVVLDRPGCASALPFVATENREAARALAERAHALGHRRVALLNAPAGDLSLRERYEGFREVFGRGIRKVEVANEAEAARAAVAGLLREPGRPTLLAALSEPLAIGAVAGVRDLGLAFGEALSFVAFDDFPLAAWWTPRLTVVRQDVDRLAAETVRLLLARLKDPAAPVESVRVPAVLEWRESVVAV